MKRGGDLGKVRFRSHGVQGSGFKVQGSGLAHGAGRPLITYEIGSAGSTGSEGRAGVVRRIKIWKRRGV